VAPTWWTARGTLDVADGAPVKAEELREAMAGRGPAGSGKQLVQVQLRQGRTERDGGFDLHLAPPKGVSVLFAAADAETRRGMLEDMRKAAADTIAELHRQGAFVVRQGRGGAVTAPAPRRISPSPSCPTRRRGTGRRNFMSTARGERRRREDGKTGCLNPRRVPREGRGRRPVPNRRRRVPGAARRGGGARRGQDPAAGRQLPRRRYLAGVGERLRRAEGRHGGVHRPEARRGVRERQGPRAPDAGGGAEHARQQGQGAHGRGPGNPLARRPDAARRDARPGLGTGEGGWRGWSSGLPCRRPRPWR
jgi:TrwC relaxase